MSNLAENKRARFDYEILETFDAGIELFGFEVKAIRAGRLNLTGSYIIIRGHEAYLLNADLPPYQPLNTPSDYDPKRTRKLLLKKDEIKELMGRVKESGLTILPLNAYTGGSRNRFIKLKIGLGKSKKKKDKRETIKKREIDREIRRAL